MSSAFSLVDEDALSFDNQLGEMESPADSATAPVAASPAANGAATSSQPSVVGQAAAGAAANAINGLGIGLGTALANAFNPAPTMPQYYAPTTSRMLPMLLVGGAAILGLMLILKEKK